MNRQLISFRLGNSRLIWTRVNVPVNVTCEGFLYIPHTTLAVITKASAKFVASPPSSTYYDDGI